MQIIPNKISGNLVAKTKGLTQFQPETIRPEIFEIRKIGDKIEFKYHDPTFKKSVSTQPNNCVTTIILKPCILFRKSFKVKSVKQVWESGTGIYSPGANASVESTLISKNEAAKWLTRVLKSVK